MNSCAAIDTLSAIPVDATFSDLSGGVETGRAVRGLDGKSYKGYREGVLTKLGDVEKSVWCEAMRRLIARSGEQDIFKLLIEHISGYAWIRTKAQAEYYALELHSNRIFKNEKWVDYQPFRVKMLEAGLVPAPAKADDAVSVCLEDFIMEDKA